MSQARKAQLWNLLKNAGVTFPLHYREYTTENLEEAYTALQALNKPEQPPLQPPAASSQPPSAPPEFTLPKQPRQVSEDGPDQQAGLRLNTRDEDEPIRVDPVTGFIWYQDEVKKPSFPKPRGRRVYKYDDPGVKQVRIEGPNGASETIEMPGDERRASEVRVTLPSYQVGIYKDPRFPFKIHVYNDVRGFDLFDVRAFYNGGDMVPDDIKMVYIENSLCYDIRTTIRAIQAEHRELVLKKGK